MIYGIIKGFDGCNLQLERYLRLLSELTHARQLGYLSSKIVFPSEVQYANWSSSLLGFFIPWVKAPSSGPQASLVMQGLEPMPVAFGYPKMQKPKV